MVTNQKLDKVNKLQNNNVQEENCQEDTACAVDYTNESKKIDIKKIRHEYVISFVVFLLTALGIVFDHYQVAFFTHHVSLIYFLVLYLIIGGKTIIQAGISIISGEFYNEFVLMTVATLGAFLIGYNAEAVSVMLFYVVGEIFQENAVNKAKKSIEALLKVQVDEVSVLVGNKVIIKHPKKVSIGQIIQIKAGEKVALDGILTTDSATFNTSALTGESLPKTIKKGEEVLAGMINLEKLSKVEVTTKFNDTKLSRILELVQKASSNKAKTQKLVSRLAKIYTPIVFWLAVALVIVPFFFLGDAYVFQTWFQRALIFLVISCPCALVISIPLGYFGGIGAGSKNGILFKGANYLDKLTKVDTIVMDKTGTLTKGNFEVQQVETFDFNKEKFLKLISFLEKNSTHPIAKAIVKYANFENTIYHASNVTEYSGQGIEGEINKYHVLIGNGRLFDKNKIDFDKNLREIKETVVLVAINKKFAGYLIIADTLKEDAKKAIEKLKNISKIKEIIMLSGDKQPIVDKVGKQLGIDISKGGLLPEDKLNEVKKLKEQGKTVAFIGDGINDAPVITIADVGFAMGGLGSDAAVETADVIIQTDQPSKIATSIEISNATNRIIWQNIILALSVKILVLILGAFGLATMWEAVIADVGVALLAIMNAVRIQRMKFDN